MKKKVFQSLIFDKEIFYNKSKVKEFIYKNNFKIPKNKKNPIMKCSFIHNNTKVETYRVRQKEPSKFIKSSLKKHKVMIRGKYVKGLLAVKGYLKGVKN